MSWTTYAAAGAIAFVGITGFGSPTAFAQTAEQLDWCNGKNHPSADLRIGGCTAVIQSGKFTGSNLATAFIFRGLAYRTKGEIDRAIQDYGQAISLEPNNATAFNNRCFARAAAGRQLDSALKDCDESLRLRPNDPYALDSRGLVRLKLGQFKAAEEDYSERLQSQPKSASSLYGRGWARLKLDKIAEAESDFAAARAIDPKVAETYAGYGVK